MLSSGAQDCLDVYLSGMFIMCQLCAFDYFLGLFPSLAPLRENAAPWGGGGMCILSEICMKRA